MRDMTRREAVGALGALGALAAGAALSPRVTAAEPAYAVPSTSLRLEHSVSRWCYGKMPLDDLCAAAKGIGYDGIDLLDEKDYEVPKKHGLVCSMANGFGAIPVGFNRIENHEKLIADAEKMIPIAAASGVPNIVCFSGNRAGLSDGDGIANCITGLKRLAPAAEKYGVTLCMELLNSKIDHHDYQADHTAFGVQVVQGVASPRVKLLYDIYHMQIMEGDIIRTIRENIQYIAHFHTGGVPGRHELDDTQELNWHAISEAIADLKFPGFMAHEFIPTRDPMTSLAQAVKTCTV